MMKYFGGKSCQATYPQGISLLIYIFFFFCLCQYQVAPGHVWQMHLSPSTRYGRLANGFLVGFKPHAGFSFPTPRDEFSMIIMENMGVEILGSGLSGFQSLI